MKHLIIYPILFTVLSCSAENTNRKISTTIDNSEKLDVSESYTIAETQEKVITPDTIINSKQIVIKEKKAIEKEDLESEQEGETDESIESNNNELQNEIIEEVIPVAYSPSHSAFNNLLVKYVSKSGNVNYSNFLSDIDKLDDYLLLLAKNFPTSKWTRNEKLTYWINLYNAGTIQLILNNYPVKSIMDINGGKAWDVKFIKSNVQTLSLNQIENEIIRPTFKEPRIHFAVNCAANSCPKLLNAAFYAHKLDSQLDQATKKFINNSLKNNVSPTKIKVSKIFEWYAIDFGGESNLINFLNKFSNVPIENNAKISYMEYNWDLNN